MQVWQVSWVIDGRLLIWGEHTGRAEAALSSPSTGDGERRHPFALLPDEIARQLAPLELAPGEHGAALLSLPSANECPAPSERLLLQHRPLNDGPVPLQSWEVPVLAFEPLDAVYLLSSLPSTPPPGVRFDDSVLFWVEATKLLLELLSRGRFLPGMQLRDGDYHAQWLVVPTEEQDTTRLVALARAMPPVCRAPERNNGADKHTILESFIATGADALIRGFSRAAREAADSLRSPIGRPWLHALTNKSSLMEAPTAELVKFDVRLKRWNQTVSLSTSHTLRTCIILSAPESAASPAGNDGWSLRFGIQAADDPSKVLHGESLWDGELGFLRFSEYSADELQERMLRDLAKACRLFPPLERALLSLYPVGLRLSTEEAYQFLRSAADLLEHSGFGIVLPTWWHSRDSQLGLHLTIAGESGFASSGQFLGLQKLVDFSWEVSLGDLRLTLDEFRQLVERKAPLVEIGGRWVELKPQRVRTAIDFLEKQQKLSKMRLLDALRLGLGVEEETVGLPVLGLDATGWIGRLLAGHKERHAEITQPSGFKGSLRPYQREGLSWLTFLSEMGCGACLADDMGLGKTIQLLALLLWEREREPGATRPTLLIAPMSILDNWQIEAARFAPSLRTYLHHGPTRLMSDAFYNEAASSDLVITTYSLAARDEALLNSVAWGRIALDEAQNIKNQTTKQTRAIRRIARAQLEAGDGVEACQRVVLTGTPVENHLEELWSIFDFLNPGYLGTIQEFRSRFAVPIERLRNQEAAARLAKVIQPFVLRRLKTDRTVIDDLPEKIEMEVYTNLVQEQAALYQRVVEEMLPQVDRAEGIQRKGLVLATITRLKQICDHPALFLKEQENLAGRSGKLSLLEELLDVILAEGDRALIFTQYAQMGQLLRNHLQERFGTEVLFLHGGVNKRNRTEMVARFQKPDGPSLFVLSLKVGGLGLNLTAANQIIHYDQWWNPAVEDQATDRAFRIGQKRNVQVRKFVCRGTLEERIAEMLRHKKELASSVVGSTKQAVTGMSTEQLRELISLGSSSWTDDEEAYGRTAGDD